MRELGNGEQFARRSRGRKGIFQVVLDSLHVVVRRRLKFLNLFRLLDVKVVEDRSERIGSLVRQLWHLANARLGSEDPQIFDFNTQPLTNETIL